MPAIVRLHLAHADLPDSPNPPFPWISQRAHLALRQGELRLILPLVQAGQHPAIVLPIQSSWQADVLLAFRPWFDEVGKLHQRVCLAVVGGDDQAWVIDLMPLATSCRVALDDESDGGRMPRQAAAIAAAVLLSCPALPAEAATYTVQKGDTLSSISRKLLGHTSAWRDLYLRNRHQLANPNQLAPGMVLELPDSVPNQASQGQSAAAPRQVTVQPGDTLYAIAQRHLGDGKRWGTLWQDLKHRIASPHRLPVGLVITLPQDHVAKLDQSPVVAPPGQRESALPEPAIVPLTRAIPLTPATVLPSAEPVINEPIPSEDTPEPIEPVQPAAVPINPSTIAIPQDEAPAVTDSKLDPLSSAAATGNEPPFATHLSASFNPVTYQEAVNPQQVTARGTIYNSFGAGGAWRIADVAEVSADYLFNDYPLTRQLPTPQDRRREHHGQLMAYGLLQLSPGLELALGGGGQLTGYSVFIAPPAGRPGDVFDDDYQRILALGEAKLAYQPWPDQPLTVSVGLSGVPYGQGFRLGSPEPIRLWGVGWQASMRYTIGALALESRYRGLRLFGDDYGQSTDMLHAGIGYYFR